MSVNAPVFDPARAAQRLGSQFQGAATLAGAGPLHEHEQLRHNIAQMYLYYNHLILRQRDLSQHHANYAAGYPQGHQPLRLASRENSVGRHRTETYSDPERPAATAAEKIRDGRLDKN